MTKAEEVLESLRVPRRRKIVSVGRDNVEGSTVLILECDHLCVIADANDGMRFFDLAHVYKGMVIDCRECCA